MSEPSLSSLSDASSRALSASREALFRALLRAFSDCRTGQHDMTSDDKRGVVKGEQ